MRLLILTNTLDCLGENDAPISNAFRRLGCEVVFGELNSISADDYRFSTRGALVPQNAEPYHPGASAEGKRNAYFLDECQLVWVMNHPQDRVSLDIWQMLWLASQHTSFVNSVEGLMFLTPKHALGYVVPKANRALSYISNDFSLLWDRYQRTSDQWWVAKPPNSTCGQNVFLLTPKGPNVRAILQCLTGNTAAHKDSYGELGGFKADYTVLQEYIPEVVRGEKRVLVACGEAVAWHGRLGHPDDHRSNIVLGGKPVPADLHQDEIGLAESIGRKLMAHGINFAGIDMAYPYIIEINLVNPGGLYDLQLASGVDRSDKVAELIIAHFTKDSSS
ncbi:RimK family alpha-L-glutamate ligase [Bradyrhizobium xenonodulans]|uniref:RimK family alpha-L-glutamate ligase n=1 Tax=Bradyrhizobium xenonodulans TaxID=2736875 RepID=A0ABY7MHF1_9BRAD|nr:RimK family alpha-L-glutamate ligase [Bradyrhizobium xenonodulans]WBL77855.1 RimK family alpha-L-glutamate ligase [Bradyrhizobium xenonodulans]